MLLQPGTSSCSCLGFGRLPRRGTVLLPVWGMKTRKKGETGMRIFLPFLLGALRSSSTAGWGNAPFKTPPALASNAFAPTASLWPSLPSPNLGALTQLPFWIFNFLCISGAAHALLKHCSQKGRGKSGFLLKSWFVKAFYIAACQERNITPKRQDMF